MSTRKIRVLVGKPGLDGHDRRAKTIAAGAPGRTWRGGLLLAVVGAFGLACVRAWRRRLELPA